MKEEKIRIDFVKEQIFLNSDGRLNKEEAIKLSGKFAGVCYDKEGYTHLIEEPEEKTMRRVDMTLNNGHHSVYDHITVMLNIQNIPKILAMIINNEHQYTTSEKSARYTPVVVKSTNSIISQKEVELYTKWIDIFKLKIKEQYGDFYNDAKIQKLAQENARYLVTVFMPTQMIYSTSLRQINYLASWMQKYIDENKDKEERFNQRLCVSMQEFIEELHKLNILEEGLLQNEKERGISLFGNDLEHREIHFGDVYSTTYKGSLAQLAQAQRHRTLNYQMEFLTQKEYFIPPIIANDTVLVNEWLTDMNSVENIIPQGELVRINERGLYENFILKCKERLCTTAQLEIMLQTRETLLNYKEALEESGSPLVQDIAQYLHGARCTFPDFKCTSDCKFKEGKTLIRKI